MLPKADIFVQSVHVICHLHPPASLTAFAAVVLAPSVLILAVSRVQLSTWQLFLLPGIYLLALISSISFYRLSPFHPLAKYPGPVLACITRLWAMWRVVNGKQHVDAHELFLRYGDVVRTGPNHLIIRDASVIPVLHGSKDRWVRTESELLATLTSHSMYPKLMRTTRISCSSTPWCSGIFTRAEGHRGARQTSPNLGSCIYSWGN
jgi:hypothetical protein